MDRKKYSDLNFDSGVIDLNLIKNHFKMVCQVTTSTIRLTAF